MLCMAKSVLSKHAVHSYNHVVAPLVISLLVCV